MFNDILKLLSVRKSFYSAIYIYKTFERFTICNSVGDVYILTRRKISKKSHFIQMEEFESDTKCPEPLNDVFSGYGIYERRNVR